MGFFQPLYGFLQFSPFCRLTSKLLNCATPIGQNFDFIHTNRVRIEFIDRVFTQLIHFITVNIQLLLLVPKPIEIIADVFQPFLIVKHV